MRKLVHEYQNITNGDMSGNITSSITNIENCDNIGIQLVYTGTPVGTITVEVSNNYKPVTVAGDWTALTFSEDIDISGPGSLLININQVPYKYLRIVYTQGSSTGVLNSYLQMKTVGA